MKKTLLAVLGLFAVESGTAQLDNALVLHIPVDNSITDVKGAKAITNNGASLTLDRFGRSNNALDFDGISDHLSADFTGLNLDSFSYSVWVKFDDHPANNQVSFILNGGGNTKDAGINLANNYAGYTGFSGFSYTNSGTSVNYTTGSLPSKGAWHHVVLSRYSDKVQVYVDGSLAGTSAASSIASYSGANLGFWVGARFGTSNFFKGVIDDVRVYNRPISASEVTSLYSITNSLNEVSVLTVNPFPNPSTGQFSLQHDALNENASVQIYNALGALVNDAQIVAFEGGASFSIQKSGLYFIEIRVGDKLLRSKVLVK